MDYAAMSKMIGYPCHPLDGEGTRALIDIPFAFADGDDIPAYLEVGSDSVRFFDDGEVFDHFDFRGLSLENEQDTEFLSAIAVSNGVSFTDAGEIRIDAAPQDAACAFAKYVAAMLAFVSWEKAWEASKQYKLPITVAK